MAAETVVLVVDDDAGWREVVVEALEGAGVRAEAAENGLDALLRLRRGLVRPDVIVSDLAMPVLDGWQLRDRLLRDPRFADIPLVVLSSSDPGTIVADRRLAKPCAPAELVRAVNGLARRRAA
jgi:CheY-like chemotaxis protein